ncbi:hypothetical protein SUGI_0317200 [Cryptomeria japonica]|nr:hypothetical protein SUGI_0317200 [Cryptomeria japonica]
MGRETSLVKGVTCITLDVMGVYVVNGSEVRNFEVSFRNHSVAQALFDLENTNQELKSELKDLYINSAKQVDISGNRKAIVIHVPYRLRKAFRKIHVRLVRELEKKFSGKDVVMIATRRILRPPKKGSAAVRPRSRTLTSVHEATLEDVVYPAEIVGKRVRYRVDGSKIMKVYLDPKERNNTEYKLETFTGRLVKLSFLIRCTEEFLETSSYRQTFGDKQLGKKLLEIQVASEDVETKLVSLRPIATRVGWCD